MQILIAIWNGFYFIWMLMTIVMSSKTLNRFLFLLNFQSYEDFLAFIWNNCSRLQFNETRQFAVLASLLIKKLS